MKQIPVSQIRTDAGTQSRVCITTDVVDEYAERMLAGDPFPPVVVFHDGSEYFLADGFHRVMAATRNQSKEISAEVHKGTRLDALKYSLGANRSNGLRRTNSDKRRCVVLALESFGDESDGAIALMCGVSQPFVSSLRPQLITVMSSTETTDTPKVTTRTGLDGKSRGVKPKKSRRPSTPPPPPLPPSVPSTRVAPAIDEAAVAFRLKVEKAFLKFLRAFKASQQTEVKQIVGQLI